MENKTKKILIEVYDIYILALIITMNMFFYIFVHSKSDMTPNIALLVVSLPIIIIQGRKLIKMTMEKKDKNDSGN
jgi:hypothetical protein